jgi:hypothetical protein
VRTRLCFLTLFLSAVVLSTAAQQTMTPGVPPPQHKSVYDSPTADPDDARARLTNEMAKKASKERVVALKNETDRLLKLSVELKQFVDKSDENVLSLDVIKKADEIEKLAKSVKDKMKGPN